MPVCLCAEREQGAIKVADIGHLYAELSVHIEWSERLEEEMWRQGDVEKERNMKVSCLSHRACQCIAVRTAGAWPCVAGHKASHKGAFAAPHDSA